MHYQPAALSPVVVRHHQSESKLLITKIQEPTTQLWQDIYRIMAVITSSSFPAINTFATIKLQKNKPTMS